MKSRTKRLTCFHCGRIRHKKKDCWFWKKEQKEQKEPKSINTNKKSSNTKEGEKNKKKKFIVSVEEVCLYISSSSIDWVLDSRASKHVTPCKNNFVTYEEVDHGKVHLGNNNFCNIVGVGDL